MALPAAMRSDSQAASSSRASASSTSNQRSEKPPHWKGMRLSLKA
jgi:hypothetical protein